jgi:hypothetical protein
MVDRDIAGRTISGHVPGEKNGQAILTWAEIRKIREMHDVHRLSTSQIADRYPVGREMILRIVRNLAWRDPDYSPRPDLIANRGGKPPIRYGESHHFSKLTRAQVIEIRRRYRNGGVTYRQLAIRFGVSKSAIGNIIRKRVWVNV